MISLEQNEIHLRALEPEDLSLLIAWENNPAFWTAAQQKIPYSEYLIKEYLKQAGQSPYESGQLRLVICKGEQSIGLIDCFDFDAHHQRAGIGILIAKSEESGKGYAQTALKIFAKYLFDNFNLIQLYAGIAAGNEASIRLFQNCGFVQYGLRKDWYRQGETFVDEHLFQLLKKDL